MTRSVGPRPSRSAMLLLGVTLVLACGSEPTAPSPVASVTVAPATTTVVLAESVQLVATTMDASGTVLAGRTVSWASSAPQVATVSSTGLVTGVGAGTVTVTATSETRDGTASITVVSLVFAELSAGAFHTCGVTTAGTASCWGDNLYAQLGFGDRSQVPRPIPALVKDGGSFAAVAAAGGSEASTGAHSCGLTTGGTAYCWGYNSFGQLGNGNTTGPEICLGAVPCASTPVAVTGGQSFASLSTGNLHTCALTPAGAAYCWGGQRFGELGNGTAGIQTSPVPVVGGVSFAQVSAGYYHTCGITAAGAAYCWGFNNSGQLGDGSQSDQSTPVPVTGGISFAAVSAGGSHTCGVTAAGVAWCWGFNGNGELGDGTRTDRLSPVLVAGGVGFTAVSVGTFHTCGLTAAGAAHCWGYNGTGQLGDGTTTDQSSPTLVAGGVSFAAVSAGGLHTCGRTAAGTAYCWGFNREGQLGDGTMVTRNAPVKVLGQP
jgi:alpha-tubulin suppressor-like RCC1 family protein